METLMKQLSELGLSEAQKKVEEYLADLPSFALAYHDQIIRHEPVNITLAMKRSGIDDYRLDAFHLARIIVPEKDIAGINTRALEDRIKQFNWQTPYTSYSLEERAKIDRIWNDYWLLAKEPSGKDIQARLFLKYWKDSQMGSGAPRAGLEVLDFQTSHRFPVTQSLSFTVQEAFDLMDGKKLKKMAGFETGEAKEKQFILLKDEDPLHQKRRLFEISDTSNHNAKGKEAVVPRVSFVYDDDNNKHGLPADEHAKWGRIANLPVKLSSIDYFQELMTDPSMGHGRKR